MKVALAQTKPITGDLEGNTRQILEDIARAKEDGADVILFPETAITGYCCGAKFKDRNFVETNKNILEEIIAKEVPDDLVAVIGFVDIKGERKNGDLNITNAAAVIQGGRIVDVYDKVLLANENHHEDTHYFSPGTEAKVIEVTIQGEKVKIGTPICEDVWDVDHERDIVAEMVEKGAEVILCPNQSYFYFGKQEIRKDLFSNHAKDNGVPIVMLNSAGVGDFLKNILIFDGASLALNANGDVIAELARFGPDYKVIDLASSPIKTKKWNKMEEIFEALIFEQSELFRVSGIENANVHVSGGIDSAVTAALVVEAMGIDHVQLITNPSEDNDDLLKSKVEDLADQLGMPPYWDPIQEAYQQVLVTQTKAFGKEPSTAGKACIQAVQRSVQGLSACHHFNSGIVSTGNHTENVLGWATFHDIGSIGVHAIIGDLTKVEVFQLAKYINERAGKKIISKDLYDGTILPAAELPDAKDDPWDYFVYSGICAELIRARKGWHFLVEAFENHTLPEDSFPLDWEGKTIYDKLTRDEFASTVEQCIILEKRSVFKTAQAAPGVVISPTARGLLSRETLIDRSAPYYGDLEAMKKRLGLADE